MKSCKLETTPFMERKLMHCGGDGEKYESRINSAYGAEDFPPAVSKGELEMA